MLGEQWEESAVFKMPLASPWGRPTYRTHVEAGRPGETLSTGSRLQTTEGVGLERDEAREARPRVGAVRAELSWTF